MNDEARGGGAENMALARARAALDRAQRVMAAGTADGSFPSAPAQSAVPAQPAGRSWAAPAGVFAAAALFLFVALHLYRSRAARMEEEVSRLTAAVAAAEERQRASAESHARAVEDLRKRIESLARPAETPLPRRKFLGLF